MKKINEDFVCAKCGKYVPIAKISCRNHCPYCFTSMHLDQKIPGDRKSECKGEMFPIEYKLSNGEIKILFKCKKCSDIHWNKSNIDDEISCLDEYIKKYYIEFI
ncbi:RNHCP domain-containing protein [Candidatus Vampirococcus lugosii]|uniref:RNHCP domain-containing protein n=1 Tax=Candidatus Vampirococcus lugosii TaxID=2789015 RepID=A0ABS5QLD8_9BACT|nr:RNHCP domain-containing protein [Candidatus Vampirococcus lugosii]MBS8122008.1 hypothetical protein [Candidatus Vampirococcus lugosii]